MSRLGGRWNAIKKCWIFPSKIMDDILSFFASKTVKVHLPEDRLAASIAAAAGTSLQSVSVSVPVASNTNTIASTSVSSTNTIPVMKQKTISITTDGADRIKICGSNTYGIKDWLKKELGASWDFTTKCWVISPLNKPKLVNYIKSLNYTYTE